MPAPPRNAIFLALSLSSPSLVAAAGDMLYSVPVPALDWQPLPVEAGIDVELRCRQCRGRFVDPQAGLDPSSPVTTPITITADDTQMQGETLRFSGNVTLRQGSRLLRADTMVLDREQSLVNAAGEVTLREPGVLLIGEQAEYNTDSDEARLTGADFVLHDVHLSGSAQQLDRSENGDIRVIDGAMTFCAPDDPSWIVHADRITITPDSGLGEARGARFDVAGVPVFYLPWLQFPVDDRRKTGVLFPDIGSDTRGGLDLTVPIYLNLAPHYDATYSPRYIDERGLNHQLNGRWLSNTLGRWELDTAYLSGDERYRNEHPDTEGTRWLSRVRHSADYSGEWRTLVDYARVSDIDYIRDLDNQFLSAQRQTALLQLGQIDYLGEDWTISLQAQSFQSLAEDIRDDYKKLPQITGHWRGRTDGYGLDPIATIQYSRFDADGQRVTGDRLYAEVGATYPMRWAAGFIKPTLKYRSLRYELEDPRDPLRSGSPSAGSAVASLDAGVLFERAVTLNNQAMTQTLEPRLYYLYSHYTDQRDHPFFDSAELTFSYDQMYRDTRFSGHDRLDDANQVTLGLTTRLFSNADGREQLNASIGQVFYFRDRDVRLNGLDPALTESISAIAAEFNWLPSQQLTVRSSVLYDTQSSDWDAARFMLTYRPGNGRVFNAGYTLREPPPSLLDRPLTEQATLSAYYPIDDNWRVFGALEYSIETQQAVEDMIGVEYDDCCWQVRLLYMRYVDTAGSLDPSFISADLNRQNALQFQFVIKGMGGFGSRVENLLNDMIRGFNERY